MYNQAQLQHRMHQVICGREDLQQLKVQWEPATSAHACRCCGLRWSPAWCQQDDPNGMRQRQGVTCHCLAAVHRCSGQVVYGYAWDRFCTCGAISTGLPPACTACHVLEQGEAQLQLY